MPINPREGLNPSRFCNCAKPKPVKYPRSVYCDRCGREINPSEINNE